MQQDHELVAGIAGNQIGSPQCSVQALGDFDQHLVASVMTQRIVDLLELIEVDEQDRELLGVGAGVIVRDALSECASDGFPVGQAGQPVGTQAKLHRLEALCQFADLVATYHPYRCFEVAVADAAGRVGDAFEVAHHPVEDPHADEGREYRGNQRRERGAEHVLGHAMHEVLARNRHHRDPFKPCVVLDAVECGVDRFAIGTVEDAGQRPGVLVAILFRQQVADLGVGAFKQRVATVRGAEAHIGAIGQLSHVRARRGGDQLAIGLDDEGKAVGRDVEPPNEVVEPLQRNVGSDHAFELAVDRGDPPRAGGNQFGGSKIDIDGRPGMLLGGFAGLVPGTFARIEKLFFAGCELELAIDAQKAVQRAVFLGVELDPQFAFLHRGPVKPDGLAEAVTVIDVVVGILVQRGGDPEARTQVGHIVGDRGGRRHAVGKGRFEDRARAHDMTVDRLTDAGHDFLQMMFGYGLDGAAAGEIGERPDDEREGQHQRNVWYREDLSQREIGAAGSSLHVLVACRARRRCSSGLRPDDEFSHARADELERSRKVAIMRRIGILANACVARGDAHRVAAASRGVWTDRFEMDCCFDERDIYQLPAR